LRGSCAKQEALHAFDEFATLGEPNPALLEVEKFGPQGGVRRWLGTPPVLGGVRITVRNLFTEFQKHLRKPFEWSARHLPDVVNFYFFYS